jgi:hypothetical protein
MKLILDEIFFIYLFFRAGLPLELFSFQNDNILSRRFFPLQTITVLRYLIIFL